MVVYETARFQLRGLNKQADYLIYDADGGEFAMSGAELMENGVEIRISEKRTAKIFFYKEKMRNDSMTIGDETM